MYMYSLFVDKNEIPRAIRFAIVKSQGAVYISFFDTCVLRGACFFLSHRRKPISM